MSSRLTFAGICATTFLCAWACAPDLDGLVADYSGGMPGTGATTSGGTGGADASGGDAGSVGGSTGAVGGDAGAGAEAGMSGAAGETPGTGGTAGTGPIPGSCDNLEQDPDESDVDCGGTSECERCATKLHCTVNKDCATAFCKGTLCAEPTCGDGFRNQDETATDCGGSCAPQLTCDLDVTCRVNEDCTSEFCKDELCTDHCESGKREPSEADKDCGGADCEPCDDTLHCSKAADCKSKVCFNNVCQPATCGDKVVNQDESDKDCGGACVAEGKPCLVGDVCNGTADCETVVCTAHECVADIDVPSEDLLDDFEDGNLQPLDLDGRIGNWYGYGDGTGLVTATVGEIPGKRGQSTLGMHTTGRDFTYWGSGVGVDLNNSGGGQGDKLPYDASAFTAVTFWARASASLMVTLVLPDADTDAAGELCTVCDHHYYKSEQVSTEWERYTVQFSELALENGTEPTPGPFDPGGLVSVQFRMASGIDYDLWIDDIAFLR